MVLDDVEVVASGWNGPEGIQRERRWYRAGAMAF